MAKTNANTLLLYRGRYIIGYAFLIAIFVGVLVGIGYYVPGGVSEQEMAAAVHSSQFGFTEIFRDNPANIINAPYYLLQRASITLFGVSPIAIKLPSLILATAALVALHGVVRLWFRTNVAIITSVITACSGVFLLYAQSGTPDITYFAWVSVLLLSVSMLVRTRKFGTLWLLIAATVAGLSLYSPLIIYVIAGLCLVLFIHPHARFIFLNRPIWTIALAFTIFALLATPLVVAAVAEPSIIQTILAIPSSAAFIAPETLLTTLKQYFGFLNSISGEILTPIYGLGTCLLAALGVYQLVTTKYTAKSYILTTLIVIAIVSAILIPTAVTITLLPAMLLITFALDYLIKSWYRLFPRNPYARVAGLLPLSVLMLGVSLPNIERFMYGYHYSKEASHTFSRDLALFGDALSNVDSTKKPVQITLVVPAKHKVFYELYTSKLAKTYDFTVRDQALTATQPNTVMTTAEFKSSHDASLGVPSHVIVDKTSQFANRFYLYDAYSNQDD